MPQYLNFTEQLRNQRVLEIDPVLRRTVAKWRVDELFKALQTRGIAFGPVLAADEVLDEPPIAPARFGYQGHWPKASDVNSSTSTF